MLFRSQTLCEDFSVKKFCDIRNVENSDPCPKCSGRIQLKRGIEVGHVFKLGKKYSQSLKATFLDKNGKEKYFMMGCYGVGVGRTVAAAIEQNHDKDGIIWPIPIAPFQVMVIPLNMKSKEISNAADKIYEDLSKEKIKLRSAPKGTGIIAGGPVRAVCEVLGIKDIVAISLAACFVQLISFLRCIVIYYVL